MHPTTTRRTLIAALALAACTAAQAQAWPSKTLRIVVPYPPGGSSDIIARAISRPLGEALGQTVIVENKRRRQRQHRHRRRGQVATTATRCCCATSARWPSPVGLHEAAVRPVEGPARRDHAGLFAAPAGGAPVGAGQQPGRSWWRCPRSRS
jgi:hypothetical protein